MALAPEPRTSAENPFQTLIRRVRAGEPAAAEELVQRYEPHIRRTVRVRLDPHLTPLFDFIDSGHLVLPSLFLRRPGPVSLATPDQLLGLLATLAHHKLSDLVRKEQAECRDHGQQTGDPAVEPASRVGPGQPLMAEAAAG